jgi:hypothetical protein
MKPEPDPSLKKLGPTHLYSAITFTLLKALLASNAVMLMSEKNTAMHNQQKFSSKKRLKMCFLCSENVRFRPEFFVISQNDMVKMV